MKDQATALPKILADQKKAPFKLEYCCKLLRRLIEVNQQDKITDAIK